MSSEKMPTDMASAAKDLKHLPLDHRIAFFKKVASDCVTDDILNPDFERPAASKSGEPSLDSQAIERDLQEVIRQRQDKQAEITTHLSLPVRQLILTDQDRDVWDTRLEKLEQDKFRIMKNYDQLLSIQQKLQSTRTAEDGHRLKMRQAANTDIEKLKSVLENILTPMELKIITGGKTIEGPDLTLQVAYAQLLRMDNNKLPMTRGEISAKLTTIVNAMDPALPLTNGGEANYLSTAMELQNLAREADNGGVALSNLDIVARLLERLPTGTDGPTQLRTALDVLLNSTFKTAVTTDIKPSHATYLAQNGVTTRFTEENNFNRPQLDAFVTESYNLIRSITSRLPKTAMPAANAAATQNARSDRNSGGGGMTQAEELKATKRILRNLVKSLNRFTCYVGDTYSTDPNCQLCMNSQGESTHPLRRCGKMTEACKITGHVWGHMNTEDGALDRKLEASKATAAPGTQGNGHPRRAGHAGRGNYGGRFGGRNDSRGGQGGRGSQKAITSGANNTSIEEEFEEN